MRLLDRGVHSQPFREADDLAVQIIDFGLSAGGEIVAHGRARRRIDFPSSKENAVEQPVGQFEHAHEQIWRQWPDLGRLDFSPPENSQPFLNTGCEDAPIIAVLKLASKGPPGQGIHRIVHVNEKLSPGETDHVVGKLERCRLADPLCDRFRQIASFAPKVAGDGFMEAAVAEIDDIVADHSPNDLEAAAKALFQHLDVADAVLEAHHRRTVAAVLVDFRSGFGGAPALHRNEDDVGVSKRLRAAAIVDVARREDVPACRYDR